MKITYRKLIEKDLDRFIQMRIHQLREEGATEDLDRAPALRDYYTRHMADGTFVSWLAVVTEGADGEEKEKIVGTSGMSFVENRRISAAPVERWGFSPVCLPIRFIDGRGLQRNCFPEWWRKRRRMAAERCRSQRPIWECFCIRILGL